jgi:hypothetical protein
VIHIGASRIVEVTGNLLREGACSSTMYRFCCDGIMLIGNMQQIIKKGNKMYRISEIKLSFVIYQLTRFFDSQYGVDFFSTTLVDSFS